MEKLKVEAPSGAVAFFLERKMEEMEDARVESDKLQGEKIELLERVEEIQNSLLETDDEIISLKKEISLLKIIAALNEAFVRCPEPAAVLASFLQETMGPGDRAQWNMLVTSIREWSVDMGRE